MKTTYIARNSKTSNQSGKAKLGPRQGPQARLARSTRRCKISVLRTSRRRSSLAAAENSDIRPPLLVSTAIQVAL